jgi:hypothetical protein
MRPGDCPRFSDCAANVCPFCPQWRRLGHVKGEPVCRWLRMRAKHGGAERIAATLPPAHAGAVESVYVELIEGRGALSDALRRAATSPPKGGPTSGGGDA